MKDFQRYIFDRRGSRNFHQGGGGSNLPKKKLTSKRKKSGDKKGGGGGSASIFILHISMVEIYM